MNVGQVIEEVIRKDHVKISELSRKLHVSRRTIYNWFVQEKLSFDIICKIGIAIKHDFSKEFPDDFARIDHEIGADKEETTNIVFPGSAGYWMNKYIILLEKYSELLSHRYPTSMDKGMPDHH